MTTSHQPGWIPAPAPSRSVTQEIAILQDLHALHTRQVELESQKMTRILTIQRRNELLLAPGLLRSALSPEASVHLAARLQEQDRLPA